MYINYPEDPALIPKIGTLIFNIAQFDKAYQQNQVQYKFNISLKY